MVIQTKAKKYITILKKYVLSMSYGRRGYTQVQYFIKVFEIGTVIGKTSADKG